MDYPSFGITMEVLMDQPLVLKNQWRKSIKVLKDYPSLLPIFVKNVKHGNY